MCFCKQTKQGILILLESNGDFMTSNKSSELKTFLATSRKKTCAGIMAAPVWVMQKANKRIYNTKSKRNWRRTEFGQKYASKKSKE